MEVIKEHSKLQLRQGFDFDGLESYLNAVWQNRHTLYDEKVADETQPSEQAFLSFLRGNELKAGQHVGFLQYRELNLCIYPKLFGSLQGDNVSLFYQHLIYWLSYCRRINFPFNNVVAELSFQESFPEALIHFFAKRTLGLLQQAPYQQFELIEEQLLQVKGRLLTSRYINESLVKGNFHYLICEHEPLLFDNTLNSIVKYVARRLMQRSKFKETWYYLEQIIFVLDEVEDEYITAADCDRVKLNPLFSDYKECLDMCRFFLNNEQVQGLYGSSNQFCFLLPMNYVFEDFLCGFIEDKFKDRYRTSYQYSGWLTDQRVFRMMNDLVLREEGGDVLLIIDAKYKLRQREADAKRGISQADLYQMVAYAMRHNCRKVLLLYPLLYGEDNNDIDLFTVSSPMINERIKVFAADLQVCSSNPQDLETFVYFQLNSLFKSVFEEA